MDLSLRLLQRLSRPPAVARARLCEAWRGAWRARGRAVSASHEGVARARSNRSVPAFVTGACGSLHHYHRYLVPYQCRSGAVY